MSEKNIKSRIVHKHDIESHWNLASNFIPKQGEIIVYDSDENHPYPRFKFGNGIDNVNDLPFVVEEVVKNKFNIVIDDNNNVISGDQESNKVNENGELNSVEGRDNFVGISRLPAIKPYDGNSLGTGSEIVQEHYDNYIDLTKVRFGDFAYIGDHGYYETEPKLEFYDVYQYKIFSMTTKDGTVHTDDSEINYNNVVSVTLDEGVDCIYDYEAEAGTGMFVYDEIFQHAFTFSNEDVIKDFNAFIYTGEISGVDNVHIEGLGNTGLSNNIHAEGYGNIAGARAYRIQSSDADTSSYVLDSVRGLCAGDVYSVKIDANYDNWGKIVSIYPSANRVVVDNFIADELMDEESVTESPLRNTFRIISKPFLGTVDWAPNGHVEGEFNRVLADNAHAEGRDNTVIGRYGHAENRGNIAGYAAHAQNINNKALGENSSASGNRTEANDTNTFTMGDHTKANSPNQTARGKYNIPDDKGQYADIVGNGTTDSQRSNAYTLDWNGNAEYAGNVTSKGNVTANDMNLNTLTTALEVYGDVRLTKGVVSYPIEIVDITLNEGGDVIYNSEYSAETEYKPLSEISPLYGTDNYKDILSIGNEIKQIHRIRKVELGSNIPTSDWSYSSSKSTDDYNVFYFNLYSVLTEEETAKINEAPFAYTDDARCFWKLGDKYTALTYSAAKEKFDGAFWIDEGTSSSGNVIFRVWFVSRVGDGYSNITDKATMKNIPIELYFALREPVEEIINDKSFGIFDNFKKHYIKNSEIYVAGTYSNGWQMECEAGIGHSVSDALENLEGGKFNKIETPNIKTVNRIVGNAKNSRYGANRILNEIPIYSIENNGNLYPELCLRAPILYKIGTSYGDEFSIYRDKISTTRNVRIISVEPDIKYSSWTQGTTSTGLTKDFYLNLHNATYSNGKTLLSSEEIDKIKSGECCFYLDDATLYEGTNGEVLYKYNPNLSEYVGTDSIGQCSLEFGTFSGGTYYFRLHIKDDSLSDIRTKNSDGSYELIDPADMPEDSNDIRTQVLCLYIATKMPTTEEESAPENKEFWDNFISNYTIGSEIKMWDWDELEDAYDYINADVEFENMEISLNKRIDEVNATIETALDSIITMQNELIGGDE